MTAAMPREVWETVRDREAGCCLRCGRQGTQVHHRRPKGSGGTSEWPHNYGRLVFICTTCHDWAHANPAAAYASGWLIRKLDADDDEQIPVITLANDRLFLTDDGGVISCGKDVQF